MVKYKEYMTNNKKGESAPFFLLLAENAGFFPLTAWASSRSETACPRPAAYIQNMIRVREMQVKSSINHAGIARHIRKNRHRNNLTSGGSTYGGHYQGDR